MGRPKLGRGVPADALWSAAAITTWAVRRRRPQTKIPITVEKLKNIWATFPHVPRKIFVREKPLHLSPKIWNAERPKLIPGIPKCETAISMPKYIRLTAFMS